MWHKDFFYWLGLYVMACLLIMNSSSIAQDTLLINYQGRLTDDGGNPVTGTPSMTFTIYDGIGVSKWTEAHPSVQVDNGLFNVILGSQVVLPESVFNGEDRYLGITVGGDPEISPRILMAAVPDAATARKLAGGVETGEGTVIVKGETGDSAIVLDAGHGKGMAQIFMIEPGDDNARKLEMTANSNGSFLTLFGTPGDSAVVLRSDVAGNIASMYLIEPGDDNVKKMELYTGASGTFFNINGMTNSERLLQIGGNHHTGEASIRLTEPLDKDIITMGTHASPSGGSIKMFNPQPEPPHLYLELFANLESGPNINLYDDIGQIMGVEPMPFNEGIAIKLTEPVDGGSILEMSSNHVLGRASIKMATSVPEPPRVYMELTADATDGTSMKIYDDIGQTMGVEPVPFHNEGYAINLYDPTTSEALLSMVSNYSGTDPEVKIQMFNPQPSKAATTVLELEYDSLNGGGAITCHSDADGTYGILTGRDLSFSNGVSTNVYIHSGGGAAFGQSVGIGVWPVTNILHVLQDSPTDPIADAWTIYSSKRWKKNIEPIDGALEKVEQLRGVSFDWKSNEKHDIGLIAEEVGKVIPEVVTYEENGIDAKSVDYNRLTAVLIEAVKELKAENDELKIRIDALERR
jgi:hypothetical protein